MNRTLQKINWNAFKLKNENATAAFETLCYHLFCRKYNQVNGIKTDYNQKGLETYPIKIGTKFIGFQSKFFENKLSDFSSVKQINDSIAKAKSAYPELNRIIIYTHLSFGTNAEYKIKIEEKAKPVSIEWVVASNFESLLSKPLNLDLAQLYFGTGNEIKFIKNSLNPVVTTLLQSGSFIDLPLTLMGNENIIDFKKDIAKSKTKQLLISGTPGSGKSILMQKLFHILAGLDQGSNSKMQKVLISQGAVPMLVNLKLCASESLENILRGRQNDNNVKNQTLKFIYIFDGLDELGEVNVVQVLSYINELSHKSDTAKIILSCRIGSLNRLKAKSHLPGIIDYVISPLNFAHIEKYFKGKGKLGRIEKVNSFKANNAILLEEAKDILLISILWEVIEELPLTATVIDLLEKKINLLLYDPAHKKNMEELNLLEPKELQILELNRDISFLFQKKFQFRFPQSELQELISNKHPRLDYHSINCLLNYITHLFFDNDYSYAGDGNNYIYQHRRYQEFFFAQKLKGEYEKDPKILRELKILSSHDFFQSLFLPYLRTEYLKNNDLLGLTGLNLMEVYLGNHKGWGADNAYYKDSKEFGLALAAQSPHNFEQIINDENLEVREKYFISEETIREAFKDYNKKEKSYFGHDILKEFWEYHMPRIIRLNAELHKFKKFAFQREVAKYTNNIRAIFQEEKFIKNFEKKNRHYLMDPFWEEWESALYDLVVIKDTPVKKILQERIRLNYSRFVERDYFSGKEEGKEKLVKGFIRVSLEFKTTQFLEVLSSFDKYEFFSFLEVLTELPFLPYLFGDSNIINLVSELIESSAYSQGDFNAAFVFFKKLLGKNLSEQELAVAKKEWTEIEKVRDMDMRLRKTNYPAAILSFIIDQYSFEKALAVKKDYLRFYNELSVFCSLYKDYISILSNKKQLNAVCGDFKRYINFYDRSGHRYLVDEITRIWAFIFIVAQASAEDKKSMAVITINRTNNLKPFDFYSIIVRNNKGLFLDLVNQASLEDFEKVEMETDKFFQDYIDSCFEFSLMYVGIDDRKAIDFFARGINDGIIRHGYRKDYIVSYLLVEAFGIILRNKWMPDQQLRKCAKEIFKLTNKVRDITDGKGTSIGPYNLVETIALYDQKMAEKFSEKLNQEVGGFSNDTTASIIKSKVLLGLSLNEVEEELEKLQTRLNHEGKIREDYFIEKLKVYLEIVKNKFYSDSERKLSFENAYLQIEEILKQNYSYVDFKNVLRNELEDYQAFCTFYDKQYNIPFIEEGKYKDHSYDAAIEADFYAKLIAARNKKDIISLYASVNSYKNNIQLQDPRLWKLIVERTFELNGNIEPFVDFLKNNSYPHVNHMTANAKFSHYGLAAALNNINTKSEITKYLSYASGHGGFINIIKAYEILRDRDTCLIFFDRFLMFCKFLVY